MAAGGEVGARYPMQFEKVFAALNDADVRYVVVGGVAVVLHGYLRLTMDLDLMVDLDPEQAARAITALTDAGLRPRVPADPMGFADPETRRDWVENRNLVVFTLDDPDDPLHPVDVFVTHPIPFEDVWDRSALVDVGSTSVRIPSIDDLIALKRGTGRSKDEIDIDNLERIQSILAERNDEGAGS